MLPAAEWATLVAEKGSTTYDIDGSGGALLGHANFGGSDKYAYTGFAQVTASDGSRSIFGYGIATAASGVPLTGSASYSADLLGAGGGYFLGGTAQLDFDFAAGRLSGFMNLKGNDPAGWGPYPLGTYDFQNTVYSTGSTSFSGSLSHNGTAAGSFDGMFTGPQAQELMGHWQLTFSNIYSPGSTVEGSGALVGKKQP